LKKHGILFLLLILLPLPSIFIIHGDIKSPFKILSSSSNLVTTDNLPNSSLNNTKIDLSYEAKDYIGLSEDVWAGNYTGNNITVAILDTGIYPNHSVFTDDGMINWSQRIKAFYDENIEGTSEIPYDIKFHGTWAASILGGNSSEYKGVAPAVNLVILKVFFLDDGEPSTTLPILEKAIDWIIENKNNFSIKIASMSFGMKPETSNLATINEINNLVEKLVNEDILVVAAAGNDGDDPINNGRGTINSPASARSALAVGGVNYDGEMYDKSGKGPTHEGIVKPDVCAPAEGVYGAYPSEPPTDFVYASGTSASTPFVAGLAALMLEKNENLLPLEIKNIISLTSYKTIKPITVKDNIQGWGIVQGYAALNALEHSIEITQDTELLITLNENRSVYCQSIKLDPKHYFFELTKLTSVDAEMYLFDAEPDEYGNPILISHSINDFISSASKKQMGVFATKSHNYYLVIKLNQEGYGDFLVRLIFEYRNSIFFALGVINVLALIYVGKLTVRFKEKYNFN